MYESKKESQVMSEDEEGSQLTVENDENKEQQLNLGML